MNPHDLLVYVTLRGTLVNDELKPVEATKEEGIQFYDELIRNELEQLGSSSDLISKIHSEGYHLDLGESVNSPKYLGHIVDKRVEDGHIYLTCHSRQHGFLGAPYPDSIQPNLLRIYTNNGVTWMDSKVLVDFSEKDLTPTVSIILPEFLEVMKSEGEINYKTLLTQETSTRTRQ
jgi:hypothetical protein